MKHSALRRAAGRKTSEQARKNPGRYWTIRAIPSASRRALPVQMTAVSAYFIFDLFFGEAGGDDGSGFTVPSAEEVLRFSGLETGALPGAASPAPEEDPGWTGSCVGESAVSFTEPDGPD